MVFLRLVRAVLTVSLCILALRRLHYDPHAFLLPNRWKLLPQVIRGTGSRVYSSLPYAVDLRDLLWKNIAAPLGVRAECLDGTAMEASAAAWRHISRYEKARAGFDKPAMPMPIERTSPRLRSPARSASLPRPRRSTPNPRDGRTFSRDFSAKPRRPKPLTRPIMKSIHTAHVPLTAYAAAIADAGEIKRMAAMELPGRVAGEDRMSTRIWWRSPPKPHKAIIDPKSLPHPLRQHGRAAGRPASRSPRARIRKLDGIEPPMERNTTTVMTPEVKMDLGIEEEKADSTLVSEAVTEKIAEEEAAIVEKESVPEVEKESERLSDEEEFARKRDKTEVELKKRRARPNPVLGLLGTIGKGCLWLPKHALTPLQNMMIYCPRTYDGYPQLSDINALLKTYDLRLEMLNYSTIHEHAPSVSLPKRNAFVLLPHTGRVDSWWMFFGGNAMLGLDWIGFANAMAREAQRKRNGIGILLFDYPGYGGVPGRPSPDSILSASIAAAEALAKRNETPHPPGGWKTAGADKALQNKFELNLLGHSLGAAAALQLAAALRGSGYVFVKRVVVSAPFTSIVDMASKLLRVPVAIVARLVTHKWNNTEAIASLTTPPAIILPHTENDHDNTHYLQGGAPIDRSGPERLTIIHGDKDELVPIRMGRSLFETGEIGLRSVATPPIISVSFKELRGLGHNEVIDEANPKVREAYTDAMFG
mmetsp:Transcript_16313/g.25846  ORF Transcript_16313/g.25846 Transcript_16313/m.25846 type:complete len:703 (-) Transcript_16313:167-2275(-)